LKIASYYTIDAGHSTDQLLDPMTKF
jgi:hypothetical protein